MATVIDEASALIRKRLNELDSERKRLESALSDLGGKARKPGRPRGPKPGSKRAKGKRGKRRGPKPGSKRTGPTRKEQVFAHAKANPESKTIEIAKAIGISSNQVSNLLTTLKKEGVLKKDGRSGKWVIIEKAAAGEGATS